MMVAVRAVHAPCHLPVALNLTLLHTWQQLSFCISIVQPRHRHLYCCILVAALCLAAGTDVVVCVGRWQSVLLQWTIDLVVQHSHGSYVCKNWNPIYIKTYWFIYINMEQLYTIDTTICTRYYAPFTSVVLSSTVLYCYLLLLRVVLCCFLLRYFVVCCLLRCMVLRCLILLSRVVVCIVWWRTQRPGRVYRVGQWA